MADDSDVLYPHRDWVEIQTLKVGRVTKPEEEECVAMIISFSNQELSDVNLVHKLRSREDVEKMITALRRSTDILWPTS